MRDSKPVLFGRGVAAFTSLLSVLAIGALVAWLLLR